MVNYDLELKKIYDSNHSDENTFLLEGSDLDAKAFEGKATGAAAGKSKDNDKGGWGL
jgi:hypothetical protein